MTRLKGLLLGLVLIGSASAAEAAIIRYNFDVAVEAVHPSDEILRPGDTLTVIVELDANAFDASPDPNQGTYRRLRSFSLGSLFSVSGSSLTGYAELHIQNDESDGTRTIDWIGLSALGPIGMPQVFLHANLDAGSLSSGALPLSAFGVDDMIGIGSEISYFNNGYGGPGEFVAFNGTVTAIRTEIIEVAEPASAALLLAGLASIGALRRRRPWLGGAWGTA